jgi:signal transduction histidine kinase
VTPATRPGATQVTRPGWSQATLTGPPQATRASDDASTRLGSPESAAAPPVVSARPEALPPLGIPARVRVLLVEDDEDDVLLTRRMFDDIDPARFEVEWTPDYRRGIERLCEGCHDVCLVDYQLGLNNGVEFVREAARRECRVPIILLTGMGDHSVDLAAMEAGAADFLNKADLKPGALERSVRYAMQHRRAEEQRIKLVTERAARARAEAANEAKDHFLATLSHELRTPLTPVLMAVDELESVGGPLPERVREAVELIRRNVELEARLIDDLLDVTRVAHRKLELRREVVDVHAQLRHAVRTSELSIAGSKRLQLNYEPRAAAPRVIGDPARLQQVFLNLIRNAMKFTPDGGRIDVRTMDKAGGGGGGGGVIVEVRDTGIGIEPDVLPRIFNAFEQGGASVTKRFGGLGLGLAICQALVELHAGTICAKSEGKGRGATFTIELPTVAAGRSPAEADRPQQPMAEAPISSASEASGSNGVGGRILLVEDHPDTRKLMARLFQREGYAVTTVGSVAGALDAARAGPFDLLISDIGLPDGSGLELMRQFRQLYRIKGIALSGYGMEQDIRQSEQAGFSAHLTKPISLPQLHQAIARVLASPPAPQEPVGSN